MHELRRLLDGLIAVGALVLLVLVAGPFVLERCGLAR